MLVIIGIRYGFVINYIFDLTNRSGANFSFVNSRFRYEKKFVFISKTRTRNLLVFIKIRYNSVRHNIKL